MPIELEMVLRLLLAAALGVIIGYQRERTGKPAGLRTYVLCVISSPPHPMRADVRLIT